MSNVSINNLSYQKLEEDVHNRLGYKILRTGLTGLMVLSIVPFIVGCGKKKESDISNPQQTRIEYFNENERNSSVIIIDADFGHTTPTITFPIGGNATIYAKENKIEIKINN